MEAFILSRMEGEMQKGADEYMDTAGNWHKVPMQISWPMPMGVNWYSDAMLAERGRKS